MLRPSILWVHTDSLPIHSAQLKAYTQWPVCLATGHCHDDASFCKPVLVGYTDHSCLTSKNAMFIARLKMLGDTMPGRL